MHLGPDVWGPHGWKFIHFVALGYPKNPNLKDRENYKTFFNILSSILPCSICNEHLKQNLIKFPLTDEILSDRIKLLNWTIDLHNEVNKKNNKKIINYNEGLNLLINNFQNSTGSQEELNSTITNLHDFTKSQERIDHNITNKKSSNNNMYYLIILLILIILILYLHYKKKNN
jgi:ABC-type transport system involved in multi-copper enzyme maturation permease subunit